MFTFLNIFSMFSIYSINNNKNGDFAILKNSYLINGSLMYSILCLLLLFYWALIAWPQ